MKCKLDTLYVTDLDGTLLDEQAEIPPKALQMLNEMLDAGLPFTVATGRSWSSAKKVIGGLRLRYPMVAYNGAFVVDPVSGKDLDRCLLEKVHMERVMEIYAKHGIAPMVFGMIDGRQKVSWVKSTENSGIRRYARSRAGDPRLNPVDTVEELYRGDVFYFSALGSKEELQPAEDELRALEFAHLNFSADTYDTQEYWLETMRWDATKAHGLDKLRRLTGIERVVCFGDNMNDLPMFAAADESYAVENAVDAVKEAATGVIGSNVALGVPKFLRTRALAEE